TAGCEKKEDVRAALARLEEVDDGVAADLLLPVGHDSDVHGQSVLLAEELGRLEEREELSLVVGDSPRVVPTVPFSELERRRLPELERRRRLHVEVPVDHDRQSLRALRTRRDVADDQITLTHWHELRLAAGSLHEVPHPFGGSTHIVEVRRIGANARDRDEFAQLFDPGLLHGRRVYVD